MNPEGLRSWRARLPMLLLAPATTIEGVLAWNLNAGGACYNEYTDLSNSPCTIFGNSTAPSDSLPIGLVAAVFGVSLAWFSLWILNDRIKQKMRKVSTPSAKIRERRRGQRHLFWAGLALHAVILLGASLYAFWPYL